MVNNGLNMVNNVFYSISIIFKMCISGELSDQIWEKFTNYIYTGMLHKKIDVT